MQAPGIDKSQECRERAIEIYDSTFEDSLINKLIMKGTDLKQNENLHSQKTKDILFVEEEKEGGVPW